MPVKALWLVPYNPWPPDQGGKIRVSEVLRRITGHGVEAEVWYADRGGPTPPPLDGVTFRAYPARNRHSVGAKLSSLVSPWPTPTWETCPPALEESLRARADAFDVLVLDQSFQGSAAAALSGRLPVVVITQNVEHLTTRALVGGIVRRRTRLIYRLDAAKLFHLEKRLFSAASLVTAVSSEDAAEIRSMAPHASVRLSPNGTDLHANPFRRNADSSKRLVLTGTLSYPPNADAARRIHDSLLPAIRERVPDVAVDIVGSDCPPDLAAMHDPEHGFHVVGRVDDVVPYLHGADVFLMPLRMGGGTRLKALQAMACGTPVVSTTLGVSGLEARPGVDVQVGDVDEDLVTLTVRLLREPELRLAQARSAREFVERRYGWDPIVSALAADLRAAVEGRVVP